MNDTTSKKPLNYLDTEGTMPALWHKLKRVEELHRIVNKHLDEPLQAYCMATSFAAGKLTIVAANSSIASQLHFQSTDLLRKLKQEPLLSSLQTIHCKVQVQTKRSFKTPTKSAKMEPLSPTTASLINEIAEGIEDSKLREIMKRLAKNIKG